MADRETNVLNFWETTLTAEMGATDLSASVADLQGLTSPAYAVIEPDSPTQREVILFDGSWGASSMVTTSLSNRYLQGSAAASGLTHPNGSVVRLVPVAQIIEDLNDRVDDVSDHGNLSGLTDDDHTQYLNNTRHDTTARHGSGVVDHGSIGGLGDDDHTQYLKEKAAGGVASEVPTHDHSGSTQAGQVDHGSLTGLGDDDHPQYPVNFVLATFAEPGALSVKTGTHRFYLPFDVTAVEVIASVGTAPAGADVIVDVNINGASVMSTKPTIPAGSNVGSSTAFSDASWLDGEYVTVDIDQVGSTTAGEDLTVVIVAKRA